MAKFISRYEPPMHKKLLICANVDGTILKRIGTFSRGKLMVFDGCLVSSYKEHERPVVIWWMDLEDGSSEQFYNTEEVLSLK